MNKAGESTPGETDAPQWWMRELEAIYVAPVGWTISAEMKRAANIALKVARGERWSDELDAWVPAVTQPSASSEAPSTGSNDRGEMSKQMQPPAVETLTEPQP